MIPRWAYHSFSLELRKLISYRADFWIQFIGSVLVAFVVSYFLWRAIFDLRGIDKIGGYTFEMMMLYYVLAPLFEKCTVGDAWTHISSEIYEGTLTRYIVYPIPVLPFKYVVNFSKSFVALIQMILTLGVLACFFSIPEGANINLGGVAQSLVILFAAGYLFFIINLAVEMVAFWADNVWSLLVMVKFTVAILGGGLFPLSLFPDWFQRFLYWTPFPYLIAFPVRCFIGQATWMECFTALVIITVWSFALTGVAQLVWSRGSRNYAGVGQ